MRAWSVAILTGCPHGTSVSALFTLAETRADAIAQGARHALSAHKECPANIIGSTAYAIDADVLAEAASATVESSA